MPPSRTATRWSTGKWIAAVLAVAVHLGFIAFLIFSVTWQNSKPEAVSVELYAPPAPERTTPPKPLPEPPKPAPEPPKPAPEPPKPAPEPPKPAPKVEPPQPTKADIALKEKQEREKKDLEKREADKRDAEKKKQEEKRLAEVRDRQTREADALKAQAERERQMAKQAADAMRTKANDAYIRSIQSKIKGNVMVPPDISGNPEAIFDVVQLPTGEIIDAQLRKSSGVRAYDEAVQRAIIKSSPLPRPETPELFQRSLTLRFHPLDQ
ncbi:MAG TPA: TonB C-terminal domain-containing protein [Casimicrobiaceae bacterium]|jgi:colicin import membrane protein|nr:TonB C-terminal domain-containing protein [Casimicrobiaceae bacterium]